MDDNKKKIDAIVGEHQFGFNVDVNQSWTPVRVLMKI